MKLVLCQSDPVWENKSANLERYGRLVNDYCDRFGIPDIFVFPEFYTTGFTMNTDVAEGEDGPSVSWLQKNAKEYKCAFVASVPVKIGEYVYNRAYFVTQNGIIAKYDKRHLFTMAGETGHYTCGENQCVVEYAGWKIALSICYDLRFPVWARNVGKAYDLMINVANWPDVRINAAKALSMARAIENVSFFAFCNRVGKDPVCEYNGNSQIIDSKGNNIGEIRLIDGIEFIYADLQLDQLISFREKFPAWADADSFKMNLN